MVPIEPQGAVSGPALLAELRAAANAWNERLSGCAAPRLRVLGLTRSGKAGRDGRNTVVVRTRRWCPDGSTDGEHCYEASRTALTELYPFATERSSVHEIREADIAINAVNYSWSTSADPGVRRNLRAVLIHEIGHVLGLDHSCVPAASLKPGGTFRGEQPPPCAPTNVDEAVMYPGADSSSMFEALVPNESERDTLCAVYAKGEQTAY